MPRLAQERCDCATKNRSDTSSFELLGVAGLNGRVEKYCNMVNGDHWNGKCLKATFLATHSCVCKCLCVCHVSALACTVITVRSMLTDSDRKNLEAAWQKLDQDWREVVVVNQHGTRHIHKRTYQ